MASLTVRQLDDRLKKKLRLRAARNGRSVEEELRTILRAAAADGEAFGEFEAPDHAAPASVAPPARGAAAVSRSEPARNEAAPGEAAHNEMPRGRRVLLVIGGGIAAYKSLDLIRRLKERGLSVRVAMTQAAQAFVTPLAAGALSGERVHTELLDPQSEFDVGHIRLAREADLVVVAPATADLMAKMAAGLAGDLATAVLLASRAPLLLAPAMNPAMWAHRATRRNVAALIADGARTVGPNAGEMAESNEAGTGRMAEPVEIADAALAMLARDPEKRAPASGEAGAPGTGSLAGRRVLVTSGPTHEPIDPVRYIANRSSGKQGHAIAAAAAAQGATVTLVAGPVGIADPPGVTVVHVESARDMLRAVEAALPADAAVFAAAVADWRTADAAPNKLKKGAGGPPKLALLENPDILAATAQRTRGRPALVVGFAAETQNVVENAKQKLKRKGCDWIVANDVSAESGVMGGDINTVHLVTPQGVESWPPQGKDAVAAALVARIAQVLAVARDGATPSAASKRRRSKERARG
jgi:phosphopantothenoylcysteine decarboxylase/phosphopantothenate--cysteine ligase